MTMISPLLSSGCPPKGSFLSVKCGTSEVLCSTFKLDAGFAKIGKKDMSTNVESGAGDTRRKRLGSCRTRGVLF